MIRWSAIALIALLAVIGHSASNPPKLTPLKNGQKLVIESAGQFLPKDKKGFDFFYIPEGSDPKEAISRLSKVLVNASPNGLLLVIGSPDTKLLPKIVQGVFSGYSPTRWKGAKFVLVGDKADQETSVALVSATGAECQFAPFNLDSPK